MHKVVVIMAWTIIFSKSMAIYMVKHRHLGLGLESSVIDHQVILICNFQSGRLSSE